MGTYTELIFGATLKKGTPKEVINSIKYMLGEVKNRPDYFPFPEGRLDKFFLKTSCYFAINISVNKMWYDSVFEQWHLSTRSNLKNYSREIEMFLEWIEPFVDGGSGERDIYAIIIHENDHLPTIYALN